MADTHLESHTHGFLERVKASCAGMVVGVLAVLGALLLLLANERRATSRDRILDEGERIVAPAPSSPIQPALEGRLIHVSGLASTDETLQDAELGVAERALRLRRRVEMYQWTETEDAATTRHHADGSVTRTRSWSYVKGWKPHVVDASAFKRPDGHQNPASMPLPSISLAATQSTLGAHRLSRSLLEAITTFERVPVTTLDPLPAALRQRSRLHEGALYVGNDPDSPAVGDARAVVEVVRPLRVSVVACQRGGTFEPYRSTSGETLELLEEGTVDPRGMFDRARRRNTLLTWALRAAGWLLSWFGFHLLLRPAALLAAFAPWLGTLVNAGIAAVSALLASLVTSLVVAGAWLGNRPALGAAVAAILALLAWRISRRPNAHATRPSNRI